MKNAKWIGRQAFCFGIFVVLMSSAGRLFGQGCSDAGFCTMGAMKPDQLYLKTQVIRLQSLEISQYAGETSFGDLILATSADFNFTVGKKYNLQVKLPFMQVYGDLAYTSGIGDVSLSLSRPLYDSEKFKINATLGAKLPTGRSDLKSADGRPLPMYYQTTLGTYDLILGTSLITQKWLFALGYQQALNRTENAFKWGAWESSEHSEIANLYPVSDQLLRGVDIMSRIERNFRFSRLNFNVGLLWIYRLNSDEITSPKTGERTYAGGSSGAATTFLYGVGYRFSVRSALKISGGERLQQRAINPDGLSRERVLTIGFNYHF